MDHRETVREKFRNGEAYPNVRYKAMWYVIQTITGKETETADVIDRVLEKSSYKRCFVIQRECVWRMEGRFKIYTEPLFPSYVFVETDTPEEFFFALKRVPRLTKLLGSGDMFWSVWREDVEFLRRLIGNDEGYIVRRSLVKADSNGDIISAEGVLKDYTSKIVRKRLRKRVVMVEIPFLGEVRRIQLGIRLEND